MAKRAITEALPKNEGILALLVNHSRTCRVTLAQAKRWEAKK